MRLLIRTGRARRLRMVAACTAVAGVLPIATPRLSAEAQRLDAAAPSERHRVLWLSRDLHNGRELARESPERLDTPILAGSVLKIALVAAALEAGVITDRTGVACARDVRVGGRQVRCTHPDLHRPLRAADALAHSCNGFASTVADRVPRAVMDRVLRDLDLPPSDPGVPMAAVALGLDGVRVTPRQLVEMMARVAAQPSRLPWKPATLAVVRDGLRHAARSGTAAALGARGLDAMAKTGTTVVGGAAQGVVAGAVLGPEPVAFVLVAPGGAGGDAAALAAERLTMPAVRMRVGFPTAAGGYDVRELALDDYVAGVVAGEAAPGSPRAALDALAIAARTFALANRHRHRDDGFDVCGLTHCQVHGRATSASRAAARGTSGQVLLDGRRRPASVFFSASCGGRSARPSEVWDDARPDLQGGATDPVFLPSQVDEACAHEPGWQVDVTARDLMQALRAAGRHGDLLRGVRVVSRTASGRVHRLHLDGVVPPETSGEAFRSLIGRSLGWNVLKSNAWDVQQTSNGFRFTGRGAGHGVGLCVAGSVQRAARGASSAAILAHYFPGLAVGSLSSSPASPPSPPSPPTSPSASPRIVVVVPQEDRPDEIHVRALATRIADDLLDALHVPSPERVTLRFHPTVESYQRATGRQWFTAGATTASGEAHFIPLETLRSRGLLDATLRHELVHLLTAHAYRGRPAWVHEGAAVHFATPHGRRVSDASGGLAPRSTATASCPTDAELVRPASREALRGAYERAARCFADQIGTGRPWQDVR